MMKKIALIYMGGTFGCVGEPLAPLSAEIFLPKLKNIFALPDPISCFIAPTIKDSSACTAVDWLKLIQFITKLKQDHYQHFIIIHGTDTLSYAAAVCAHFLAQSATVVFTGSQFPLLTANAQQLRHPSDAFDNLSFALQQIEQIEKGVYIAFCKKIIYAQTALKIHTSALDAFTGHDISETLLEPNQDAIDISENMLNKAKHFSMLSWMIQPNCITTLCQQLKNLLQNPPHFLVLQGFGSGNLAVNDQLLELFERLKQHHCAVILTTQVPFGATNQNYAVNSWTKNAAILLNNTQSHADLYAKALKMYLKYDDIEQWYAHW